MHGLVKLVFLNFECNKKLQRKMYHKTYYTEVLISNLQMLEWTQILYVYTLVLYLFSLSLIPIPLPCHP